MTWCSSMRSYRPSGSREKIVMRRSSRSPSRSPGAHRASSRRRHGSRSRTSRPRLRPGRRDVEQEDAAGRERVVDAPGDGPRGVEPGARVGRVVEGLADRGDRDRRRELDVDERLLTERGLGRVCARRGASMAGEMSEPTHVVAEVAHARRARIPEPQPRSVTVPSVRPRLDEQTGERAAGVGARSPKRSWWMAAWAGP